MGVQLSSTLRQLCDEIGWSYAVFWRRGNRMNLEWGEAAVRSSGDGLGAEVGVGSLVYDMMAPQVHVVGDGIVGQAGLTGRHQWIIWGGHGSLPMGLTEMNHHFLAGIQTIAVIPVLPHGVVQLGSTQMVMENIEFIDHVRSLFEQLVCLPRTLVSDIAQKLLSQHNHQNASVEVSSSFSDSQDSGPYRSRFSSLDDDKYPTQLLEAPNSRYVGQHCSSLTSLYSKSKVPVNSSEVSSTTLKSSIVPLTEFSPSTIHRVVDPIIHPRIESVGAPVFSKPSTRSIEMLCGSSSASRYQSRFPSGLSSSGLTSFEEQFSSIPTSQGPANNHMANSETPKQLHGCIFSNSPMDSETVLPLAQKELPNNANDFGRCNSFGASTTGTFKSQCPISSSMNAPQLLEPMNHSTRSGIPARDSQPRCSTSIQKSQNVSTEVRLIKDENLLHSANLKATQLEEHRPCNGSIVDIPEIGWLSSSNPKQESKRTVNTITVENDASTPSQNIMGIDTSEYLQFLNKKTSISPVRSTSGSDLFDLLGLASKPRGFHSSLGDIMTHGNYANAHDLSADVSTCITQLDTGPVFDGLNQEIYCNGLFTESPPDQLLDAVVGQMKAATKDDNVCCKTSLTNTSSVQTSSATRVWEGSSEKIHAECVDLSPATVKPDAACSSSVISLCSMDKTAGYSKKDSEYKSQLSLWVNRCQMSDDNIPASHDKQIDEVGKLNRKRSRSGENPRPRPKDRQMIQDRVKELREIVPNGAKCSIDALLEKTIKHMLFLQSVTKHADKLKEVGEPKIVNEEGGLLLKDNFEGGATWAFEVGTQSMICPIIVEDLNPPRQMLVEMLCEEQGLFLEIADLIRGLGLTILKGVMEARNDKVWARFAVEANRDVARMEIFLSLVRLLEPNAGSRMVPQGVENLNAPHNMFQSSSSIPATGLSDHLR